jgi:2-haloacid dehalogenase
VIDAPIYVFDLFGTLVDYASLRSRFIDAVPDPDAFVAAWRTKQLQYALCATAMDRYADFEILTGLAFDYAAAVHALQCDASERDAARDAWLALPAFPDALEALTALQARGVRTAVLSNGTPRAIEATVRGSGLAIALDVLLSVDGVRQYKPRPPVYEIATKYFDVDAREIAFVSSNGWDATGAAEFGFRTIWCNRANLPAETFGKRPERTISTLAALTDG